MYMHKSNFGLLGRLLNRLGMYDQLKRLADDRADYYKYSTASFLIKQFGGGIGHEADYKSGHLGFGLLHYAFISVLRPERILCVGSQQGYIPAVCALACKDVGYGHVDFVDAGKDVGEMGNWGGIGFWKKFDPERHFSSYDLNKFVSSYIMTSSKFIKLYPRKYAYIYIDADHSYEGISADFKRFWPQLVAGGMMSFHDISLKGLSNGEEYGVWKFWEELRSIEKLSILVHDNGVGFIRKTQ